MQRPRKNSDQSVNSSSNPSTKYVLRNRAVISEGKNLAIPHLILTKIQEESNVNQMSDSDSNQEMDKTNDVPIESNQSLKRIYTIIRTHGTPTYLKMEQELTH